jgi:hypothetical protein
MYSVSKIQVGCQAAIAGKPAPTGTEYICKISLGNEAAIAGKSDRRTAAPTGTGYIRGEPGRPEGRQGQNQTHCELCGSTLFCVKYRSSVSFGAG